MEPLLEAGGAEAGGAEPEVRELLSWARESGGPSEAQLARLSARVAPVVGLPVAALDGASQAVGTAPSGAAAGAQGGSIAPAAATTGLGSQTLVAKVGGSLLAKASLAGVLGLGALAYVATRPQPPPPPPAERVASAAVEEGVTPEPAVEELVAPPPQAPAEVEAAPPAPAVKAAPVRRGRASEKQAPAQPPPSELSLVQAAQAARGRPAEMLRVLNRHARLYPEGMLGQERDVLRIEALVQLGRHPEAARRAAELRRRHPGSAHLARVEELLGGSDSPH